VQTGDQLSLTAADLAVPTLGPATIRSPLDGGLLHQRDTVHYVAETDRVLLDDTLDIAARRSLPTSALPAFEPGGPGRGCSSIRRRRAWAWSPAEVCARG